MTNRIHLPLVWLLSVALVAACATRRNPDLPPTDGDGDADGDDGCGLGLQLCDGTCVSDDHQDHCGGCGRACAAEGDCVCTGDPLACLDQGAGHYCFEECERGALPCGDVGAVICARQPDTDNCGACGVVCDDATACACRDPGSTGLFECLQRAGSGWEDCTATDPRDEG